MILASYPKIDLHGFDSDYACIVVKEFIEDNIKMKNRYVVIIHGVGKGILKNRIHQELKCNKKVENYKLDIFNEGQTLVELKMNRKQFR